MINQAPKSLQLTPSESAELATTHTLTIEDAQRIDAINERLQSCLQRQEKAKAAVRLTIDECTTAGKLLIEEQALYVQKYGNIKGWTAYFKMCFPTIPQRTAYAWMEIASRAVLTKEPQCNLDRKAMSQLELFPAKEYTEIPGDIDVPKLNSHLTLVNNWSKWYRPIQKGEMKLSEPQRVQLQADFKPLYEFLRDLFATELKK